MWHPPTTLWLLLRHARTTHMLATVGTPGSSVASPRAHGGVFMGACGCGAGVFTSAVLCAEVYTYVYYVDVS